MSGYTDIHNYFENPPSEDCTHAIVEALKEFDTGHCGGFKDCCLTGKDADIDYGQATIEVVRAEAGDDGVTAVIHMLATFGYGDDCYEETDEVRFIKDCACGVGFFLEGDEMGITVARTHEITVPWDFDGDMSKTAEALFNAADAWVEENFLPDVLEARKWIEDMEREEEDK